MRATTTAHPNLTGIFSTGESLLAEHGKVFMHAGQIITHVHLIREGAIHSYRVGQRGHTITHTFYGPGDVFPVAGVRQVDAVATNFEPLVDTKLYRLPRATFTRLCQENNLASYELAVQVTEQYNHYVQRVGNLQYTNAYDRVVYFLLLMAQRFGQPGDENAIEIALPLTHYLIASTVNVARETASRSMKRLTQKGIVQKRTKRYVISDVTALAAELHDKSIYIPAPFEES